MNTEFQKRTYSSITYIFFPLTSHEIINRNEKYRKFVVFTGTQTSVIDEVFSYKNM